jgi:hypothetical protein
MTAALQLCELQSVWQSERRREHSQNKVLRRTNSVSNYICGFTNELASDVRCEVATVNAKQQTAAQHKQSAK